MHLTRYDAPAFLGCWKRIRGWTLIALALGAAAVGPGAAAADRLTPSDVSRMADTDGAETERAELGAIYEALGGSLIWNTVPRRLALIKLLASLEADGIDVRQLGPLPEPDAGSRAKTDVMATRAILRAAHVVAAGSTDPGTIPGWSLKAPSASVVEVIVGAARNNRLDSLFDDLRPTAGAYRHLRVAYVRYLRLAAEAWAPLETSVEVHLDAGDTRIPEITRRFVLLGDLRAEETSGDVLRDAIKHFQSRHGLTVDGRVGPATLAALNVPPAERAEQIAANLEYWRLLPRVWPERYIVVNTAAAQLGLVNNGHVIYRSRVIVGDASHPTPVMTANITAVTFNPSWTVPYSIAVNEILPRLRRDQTYLERSGIEILGRNADPFGLRLDWRTYSRINFPFQLRQAPGPNNALGLVKFEMPNKFGVYLHDTADRSLFEKPARALSHGCVRVDCANALAQRLIDDPTVWLESDLSSALSEGRTTTVPLKPALPVFLLYFTAYADEDGSINFRSDVYGRDRALLRAPQTPLLHNHSAPNIAQGS